MAVLIRDPEADRLIRELAQRTGESITQTVRQGLQRMLPNEDEIAARKRRLAELLAYFDFLPRENEHLTIDEIIGYDENGLPT
jgi:antitoxin VapB